MKKRVTLAVAIALLAGCSDSVELVTASEISKFTPGKTAETEIVGELGKPLHTVSQADGTKIEQYPYAGGASGGSIIPSFLGGSSASSYNMVGFRYGSDGMLKEILDAGAPAAK